MDRLQRWDRWLSILLMLSFFLPLRMQVLSLIPLCVFLAIRDIVISKRVGRKRLMYAALLGGLYLLYAAYLPFTRAPYLRDLLFHLEQKASLLALPLAIACLRKETLAAILGQLRWFVLACLLACGIGNLVYLIRAYPFSDPELLNHVAYRLGFERIVNVHPTYMGVYLCFAAAILLFDGNTIRRTRSWQRGALLFLAYGFMFALFPKMPLIALLFIIGYYCILHYRESFHWRMALIPFLAATVMAFAIPFTSQRAAELNGFFPGGGGESPVDNSINMRRIIWKMDMQLLKEHWLAGVGPGQIRPELQQLYYGFSEMAGLPIEYYDTHNEYLNIWISFGLAGIALLILILSVQAWRAVTSRSRLYLCLLVALCLCFMTENVLANQRGVVFYAFFTSLLFFSLLRPREAS